MSSHGRERERERKREREKLSLVSYKGANPITHDLFTIPNHLQIPSYWGLGFQHMKFEVM
jgi:hypothetical protein